LQYSRKEDEIKHYITDKKDSYEKKVAVAKKKGCLMECVCCYNEECLEEDMLACSGGHLYCKECVQRASEVAIGEGKHQLTCLGQCEDVFALSTLQKALKANTFSKWLSRIQLAEIEKAEIDGLEQCPFCSFATIMDTTPEENKNFVCQNPDCGKDSCRLCHEISHIPLRCEEVEKDAEVRKRTYIENKMTEAMIRKCWKCSKPFVKLDGCNKMTCECGAQMCYICRQPVRDYKHFYGQGGIPQTGQLCPLWSDNNTIHESDVARGALEARSEMDKQNPDVKLKHDPAKDINMAGAGGNNNDPLALLRGQEVPPGLAGILPDDPMERQRLFREQERIEALIHGGQNHQHHHHHRGFGAHPPGVYNFHHLHEHAPHIHIQQDYDGFVHRMGELLQLREAQRQRNRAIRRREQQALEEFQIHRIGHPNAAAVGGPGGPNGAPPGGPLNQAAGAVRLVPPIPPPPMDLHFGGGGGADHHFGYQQQIQRQINPMPAHMVQPAPPIPPPPPAHAGGGRDYVPPQAHQHGFHAQPPAMPPRPPYMAVGIPMDARRGQRGPQIGAPYHVGPLPPGGPPRRVVAPNFPPPPPMGLYQPHPQQPGRIPAAVVEQRPREVRQDQQQEKQQLPEQQQHNFRGRAPPAIPLRPQWGMPVLRGHHHGLRPRDEPQRPQQPRQRPHRHQAAALAAAAVEAVAPRHRPHRHEAAALPAAGEAVVPRHRLHRHVAAVAVDAVVPAVAGGQQRPAVAGPVRPRRPDRDDDLLLADINDMLREEDPWIPFADLDI
jgi:hypothetical protein